MADERRSYIARAGELLAWLVDAAGGPIFSRELRLASRKRRTYWLRFAYMGILALLVGSAFNVQTPLGTSRAADLAVQVASMLTWGNFILAQLVAVTLLGAAMSDEARQRTLGVLLTTPLEPRRFVTGMLLGRLVQPLFVVALSFPCIALLRIFGGIPWELVSAGVAITTTTTLFAGALALCLSARSCRAVSSSGLAVGLLILLHLVPVLSRAIVVLGGLPLPGFLVDALEAASPAVALAYITGGAGMSSGYSAWPIACLVMLGATALCLALAAARFRRTAMHLAFSTPHKKRRAGAEAPIRPVRGNALVWKDAVTGRRTTERIVTFGLVALSAVTFLGVPASRPQAQWLLFFALFALTVTGFLAPSLQAAECVTREKEGRTWPLVLMLPLTDWLIVRWKLLGLARRNLALYGAILLGIAAMFAIQRQTGGAARGSYEALGVLVPRLASLSFFGLAVGLWASASCSTSRRARIETLLVLVTFPIALPLLLALLFACVCIVLDMPRGSRVWELAMHPFVPLSFEIGLGLYCLRRATRCVRLQSA